MIMNVVDKFRKEKNITQKDLSNKIGKSREWYSQALVRNNLSVEDLVAVADVFDMSPCDFFDIEQRKKEAKKETYQLQKEIKLQYDMIALLNEMVDKQRKEIKDLEKRLGKS